PRRAPATRPPDSRRCAPRRAAPTIRGRRAPLVWGSCVLPPSYLLRLRCALARLWCASPWGGAPGDRHPPFIRLRHPGWAPPTRFNCAAHLHGCAAGASSTCHVGLLPSGARGVHGTAHSREVPPETPHHTQVAVGCVEYSSRTLSAS